MNRWARASQESIIEFKNAVEAILPEGIAASQFSMDALVDNLLAPLGPHRQEENKTLLAAASTLIKEALLKVGEQRHKLFSPFGLSCLAFEKWLAHEQTNILCSLAKVVALTCGVGLNEFKYGYLRFDASEGQSRNIWLLKNGLIAFNDPTKALRRNDNGVRFFAFPRDVTHFLALYLFVIRPIGAELLAAMGRNVPFYCTNIWVHVERHPRGRNHWLWSGTVVSEPVKATTAKLLGITLTPQLIRCIVTELFSKSMPALFEAAKTSAVDEQAQHVTYTSLNNYGWTSHFPPIKNLRLNQPIKHLAVSEIWHALLLLGPTNDSWESMIQDAQLTASLVRRNKAVEIARSLIVQKYAVRSSDDASRHLTMLSFTKELDSPVSQQLEQMICF